MNRSPMVSRPCTFPTRMSVGLDLFSPRLASGGSMPGVTRALATCFSTSSSREIVDFHRGDGVLYEGNEAPLSHRHARDLQGRSRPTGLIALTARERRD